MTIEKKLEDFLPDKKAVYHKVFDNKISNSLITKSKVVEKIKKIFDPEIPINIYDLGLIYNLEIDKQNNIAIKMTLTTPNCPVAGSMPENVGKTVSKIEGVSSIKVELVWEPKWSKDMMTEDAKLALDIF